MDRLVAASQGIVRQQTRDAYAGVSPAGSHTLYCCDPEETDDGRWSVGCIVCLDPRVKKRGGVTKEKVKKKKDS